MRGSQFFFHWNMGGFERSKAGLVGVFYNKSKKLSCVHILVLCLKGVLIVFKRLKGVP